MTGVLNRRSLRDRLEREWSRAQRSGTPLSCIMLDIDYFKNINDTYGHMTGDAVLKMVAATLVQHCRPSDMVARFGGEEFCIVVPETTQRAAMNVAERLRVAIAASCASMPRARLRSRAALASRNARTIGTSLTRWSIARIRP